MSFIQVCGDSLLKLVAAAKLHFCNLFLATVVNHGCAFMKNVVNDKGQTDFSLGLIKN